MKKVNTYQYFLLDDHFSVQKNKVLGKMVSLCQNFCKKLEALIQLDRIPILQIFMVMDSPVPFFVILGHLKANLRLLHVMKISFLSLTQKPQRCKYVSIRLGHIAIHHEMLLRLLAKRVTDHF